MYCAGASAGAGAGAGACAGAGVRDSTNLSEVHSAVKKRVPGQVPQSCTALTRERRLYRVK